MLAITVVELRDALTTGTGPLSIRVAATDFFVVVSETFEAAFFLTFIRAIVALGLTIT
jgi:hypothetical protein